MYAPTTPSTAINSKKQAYLRSKFVPNGYTNSNTNTRTLMTLTLILMAFIQKFFTRFEA